MKFTYYYLLLRQAAQLDFASREATIVLRNAGTTGIVVTDAVQFLPIAS